MGQIGLPQDKERAPLLCVMEPHLAKGEMLVTPCVFEFILGFPGCLPLVVVRQGGRSHTRQRLAGVSFRVLLVLRIDCHSYDHSLT